MVDQQNSPDNHSDWNYPAPGYDDPSPTWGELLNALIEDDLDRAVVIKDTYANRPAAGEQGRWFLATDRKIVFYDDGAAWEAVAGKGTQANPVPGTTYLESLSVESGLITSSDKNIPGIPSSSSDPGLSFGTWRTPSSERPVDLIVEAKAETDGTDFGEIRLDVDETGGTTSNYELYVTLADPNIGAGAARFDESTITLPVGASYRIRNKSDPNNNNTISTVREFVW